MFNIVEMGKVTVSLNVAAPNEPEKNIVYVQEFVADILKNAFPHLTE